jgi:hypothetical protein
MLYPSPTFWGHIIIKMNTDMTFGVCDKNSRFPELQYVKYILELFIHKQQDY